MTQWILDSIKDTRLTARDLREVATAIDEAAAQYNIRGADDVTRNIRPVEMAEAFARDMAARGYRIVRSADLREVKDSAA